jgi:WS/DGAT/MGAT family acyltransferase
MRTSAPVRVVDLDREVEAVSVGSASFPSRLSGADELMWRIECDPVLRSPILVIGLLDKAPDIGKVRRTLTSWRDAFPRLRQRLVAGPRLLGGARWVDCDGSSLDFHLRQVRAPDPADLSAVLALVEPTVAAPFDDARPLWELTLVDGLVGGRAALVLRFHHAITDGVGGVELAGQLFDRTRTAARPRPTERASSTPGTPPIVSAAGIANGVVGFGLSAARHPVATANGVTRLGGSLVRALAPVQAGSPALEGRGLDRHLEVLEVPLAPFQRTADAIGCTVNDVFLAAIGGALRQYHDRVGKPLAVLQCTMPISLRHEGDARGGNRFVPARFGMPIDDPDPAARARIAGAITRRWRTEPALAWTRQISVVLDLLPRQAAAWALGGMLKRVDVDAVNVPGLRHRAYFAGAHVDRLWAFAPPTGAAMSVTLLSHVDTCCIGLMCDRAAVSRPDLVRACFESALGELLELGSSTGSRRWPA